MLKSSQPMVSGTCSWTKNPVNSQHFGLPKEDIVGYVFHGNFPDEITPDRSRIVYGSVETEEKALTDHNENLKNLLVSETG